MRNLVSLQTFDRGVGGGGGGGEGSILADDQMEKTAWKILSIHTKATTLNINLDFIFKFSLLSDCKTFTYSNNGAKNFSIRKNFTTKSYCCEIPSANFISIISID